MVAVALSCEGALECVDVMACPFLLLSRLTYPRLVCLQLEASLLSKLTLLDEFSPHYNSLCALFGFVGARCAVVEVKEISNFAH